MWYKDIYKTIYGNNAGNNVLSAQSGVEMNIEIHTSEITIATNLCTHHPLSVTPHTTFERQTFINRCIQKGSSLPMPLVRPHNGAFEVLYGWDVIELLNANGIANVKVLYANIKDDMALRETIATQHKNLELNWTSLARSITRLRKELSLKDQQIANILGIERTQITKLRGLSEKLSPKIFKMAELGKVSFTTCISIYRKSASEQNNIAEHLELHGSISNHIGARQKKEAEKVSAEKIKDSQIQEKSADIQRAETHISATLGFPVNINQREDKSGSIDYSFYSLEDLISIVRAIRKSGTSQNQTHGILQIKFKDTSDLNNQTAGFFENEEF